MNIKVNSYCINPCVDSSSRPVVLKWSVGTQKWVAQQFLVGRRNILEKVDSDYVMEKFKKDN